MKILFITNFHQLYGANRSLLSLMSFFKDCGDDVCLLLPLKGDLTEELDKKGICYIDIPFFSSLFFYKVSWPFLLWPFLSIATLLILPYIIYKVWRYAPDVIYSNTIADNIGIFIAKVIRKKHILHIRDFMNLDHGSRFVFGTSVKKKFVSMSDGVVYVSKSVAEHVLQSKELPQNHRIIYNGIKSDIKLYEDKKLPNPINFGIVGLLDEGKGQHIAIDYFNVIKDEYPKSLLHVWGDKNSSYKKKLLKMVEDYQLVGRVIFHGFEKSTDIIYKNIDVLLMCSRMEGFGRVTIEAMQRGIPVLGYNSGGTSELVKNGYNGYLFRNKDEFIYGLKQLLISDDQYNRICHQAFDDARINYSESKYASSVREFVLNILRKN